MHSSSFYRTHCSFPFNAVFVEGCGNKWKRFGNSCYLFVKPDSSNYEQERSNWKTARSHCLKEMADLVSLTTQEEVDFVYNHTKNMAYDFWIGLTYETQVQKSTPWVWSNGDRLNITQWDTGEPNNLGGEHCTHIIKKTKRWNNRECNTDLAWICEKTKSSNTTAKPTGI